MHSFHLSGQPGNITRLLSCTEEDLKRYTGHDLAPTHYVPSMSRHPLTGDWYPAINKPAVVLHWLNHAKIDAEFVVILDADMIIRGSITPWEFKDARGCPVSTPYDYLIGCHNELAKLHIRNPDACDKVGGVIIMHIDDLRKFALLWLHKSEEVRADKAHYGKNITGDIYESGWISEMYGYSFGAAELNLRRLISSEILIYPGVGNWSFDKANWKNVDVVNKCWAKFPDPPDPTSLDSTDENILQRDLLSIECARTLNEALHLHHQRRNCSTSIIETTRKLEATKETMLPRKVWMTIGTLNEVGSSKVHSDPNVVDHTFSSYIVWMVGLWGFSTLGFLAVMSLVLSGRKGEGARRAFFEAFTFQGEARRREGIKNSKNSVSARFLFFQGMGESACLMQTFSQASDTSHETREGNPMHALTESVSFGRFLSESLAWEKWSSFSHNRYLEDVEKYSRPGSVAQKKAYFEAHYKKIAAKKEAAALLEQEKEPASDTPQPETHDGDQNNNALVSHLAECDGYVAIDESRQATASLIEEGFITDRSRCNSNVEMDHLVTNKVEVADPVKEDQVLEKNSLVTEPSNLLADVGNHGMFTEVEPSGTTTHMDQTHSEENVASSQDTLTSATKAKPLVSSLKLSAFSRESTLSSSPAKSTATIRFPKENIATPNSRKSARDSVQKKCLTPKSLHMSINFAANQETPVSATKKKPAISSSKPSAYRRVSDLKSSTANSTTPVNSRKENNSTPNSTKSARDPGNKKCSRANSPHMSINLAANQDTLASATTTKPLVSSSKPSLYSRASKLPSSPAKSTIPVHSRKENSATPNSKKPAGDLVHKKCSMPKSLHMLINLTPSDAGEINKKSSVTQKIADSRGPGSLYTSKHCPTSLRTPTTASVNDLPKNPSATSRSEKRSTRTKLDRTAFGSIKEGAKWKSMSMDRLSACGDITRSSTLSSPFSFRTDERAANRKEKLKNKYNAEGAQNVQLQIKSKEKAESELKKNIGFKAKPMPDFYRETESRKNEFKKIPLTQPRSPKLGRKPISNAARDPSSLPPRRPAVKNDYPKSVIEKNNQMPTHSITALPKYPAQ
ncbi:hypothetical protein NE237_006187 [Protea cynaroides]|uniref:TPX2 C-terminal domain-containing protein n=1 Tax=Protea cynaroides TaxID=273540 RepID=A0A9Q0KLV3_9MAGN|nr:hypothetical protein NE237_006187 [Protea cynaroides]